MTRILSLFLITVATTAIYGEITEPKTPPKNDPPSLDYITSGATLNLTGNSRNWGFPLPLLAIHPNGFSLSLEYRQEPRNRGTILAITHGIEHPEPLLEVKSNSRVGQLSLLFMGAAGSLRRINVKVNQPMKSWISLYVELNKNGSFLLLIGCKTHVTGTLTPLAIERLREPGNKLWVGQRNLYHGCFKGQMRKLSLPGKKSPQVCEPAKLEPITVRDFADENCPNCFEILKQKVDYLQTEMQSMRSLLEKHHVHLKDVQLHLRKCQWRGQRVDNGHTLRDHEECSECTCHQGKMMCRPLSCPKLDCPHPVLEPGKCCPECKRKCQFSGEIYEHGHEFWPKKCVQCACADGDMRCSYKSRDSCPSLIGCPESQRAAPPNQCCQVCTNSDFCANETCHPNASCINEKFGARCVCKEGFFGTGRECYDVNECQWSQEIASQIGGCGPGTNCINTPGSFECVCQPGYYRLDEHNCMDILF